MHGEHLALIVCACFVLGACIRNHYLPPTTNIWFSTRDYCCIYTSMVSSIISYHRAKRIEPLNSLRSSTRTCAKRSTRPPRSPSPTRRSASRSSRATSTSRTSTRRSAASRRMRLSNTSRSLRGIREDVQRSSVEGKLRQASLKLDQLHRIKVCSLS